MTNEEILNTLNLLGKTTTAVYAVAKEGSEQAMRLGSELQSVLMQFSEECAEQANLSDTERKVFDLHYVRGWTLIDTAAKLERSYEYIRSVNAGIKVKMSLDASDLVSAFENAEY